MLSSIRGFINRHKKKFIVTGCVVGGTMIIFHYARKKLQEFQENQAKEFIEKTRRLNHFESTELTCNQAIIGLSSNLHAEIMKLLDTNEILGKLRKNPENKIELWENLKIISFTRLTVLIYATSMLVITLRVQLNILGGYLYKDSITTDTKISDEIRQSYLSLIQYFLNEGLQELVKLIKTKITEILKSHSLDEELRLADIEQIFWSIQMAINNDKKDPNSKILHYVLPSTINDSGLLQKMYNETLDMLESEDVTILCSNNVSRGFSIAVDNIAEYYSGTKKSNGVIGSDGGGSKDLKKKPATSKNELNEILDINKIKLHLAKIIPIINGITSKSFDNSSKTTNLTTSLITFFLVSEKIKTLGANVYEVFSI